MITFCQHEIQSFLASPCPAKSRGWLPAGHRTWRNALIHLEDLHLRELFEPAGLVESIRNGFNGSLESPTRIHQTIPGAHPSTLLIMPAWQRGGDIGIKLVTVDAWRGQQGGEAVNGLYVLLDGASGGVSALLDARVLT